MVVLKKKTKRLDSIQGYVVNYPVCDCDFSCFRPCQCHTGGDGEPLATHQSYDEDGYNSALDHLTLHET